MSKTSKAVVKEILSTSFFLLVVLVVTFLVVKYVGVRTEVMGSSMEPTLSNGDQLIVDKITYAFKAPERYDIIVFPYKREEKTYYIKRIIALPGETIYIDEEGTIFIDGEILEESYGKEVIKDAGIAYQPILLGKDEYFVMGDNRNNSSDSRDGKVGILYREDIVGKAWLQIWPFSDIHFITHQ